MIPAEDSNDPVKVTVWTRVHGRFVVLSQAPPECVERHTVGLLANEEWRSGLLSAVTERIDAAAKEGPRQLVNAVSKLMLDCPQLVYFEPIASALLAFLAERDLDFFETLLSACRVSQRGAKKDTLSADRAARVRPPSIECWEAVERWQIRHGKKPLPYVCRQIANERYEPGSDEAEKEIERIKQGYRRVLKRPAIRAVAVALPQCPLRTGNKIHSSPGPDAKAGVLMPYVDLPADLDTAKSMLFTYGAVGLKIEREVPKESNQSCTPEAGSAAIPPAGAPMSDPNSGANVRGAAKAVLIAATLPEARTSSESTATTVLQVSKPIRTLNNIEAAFIGGMLEAGIRFLVIGGHAVNFYVQDDRSIREMKDLDVFYVRDEENVQRLVSYLKSVNVWQPKLTIERLSKPMSVISIQSPVGVDLISEIAAVSFEEAWEQREIAMHQVGEIPVISLTHLRESKRASGRPQDLDDLALLEKCQESTSDELQLRPNVLPGSAERTSAAENP